MCIWWNGRTDKGDLDLTSRTVNVPSTAHQAKYQITKVNTPFFFFKPKGKQTGNKSTSYCTAWTERIDGGALVAVFFLLPKQIEATFYTSEDIKTMRKSLKMREEPRRSTTRQQNVHKSKANDK